MIRASAFVVVLAVAACGQPRTYNCTSDVECVLDGVPGRCELGGFCSFPDVDCASGARFGEHAPGGVRDQCVTQPGNDACEGAPRLALDTPAEATLRGAAASGQITCSPQVTGDVFYELVLDECSDVTLRAEAPGGNTSVALVRACNEPLGCADAFQTSMPETLQVAGVAAGTYQVAIGGVLYDGDLAVSASIAPAPVNDTQAGTLPAAPVTREAVSLARATDDLRCGSRDGGRDVYYRLSLPPEANTSWVVDIEAIGHQSTDFAVAVIDATGNQVACKSTSTGPARFRELPAGEYVVAVDGPTDGSCGGFDFAVARTRIEHNDQCTTLPPENIALSEQGITKSGDLTRALPDDVGSCGGTGNDLVYQLVVTERSHVDIRVTEATGGFKPFVYVRKVAGFADENCGMAPEVMYSPRGSCNPDNAAADKLTNPTQLACAFGVASGSAQLDLETLDPGVYQIVVDSEDGAGDFELTVKKVAATDDNRPGSGLQGACFTADGPGDECCGIGTTVGADYESPLTCSLNRPDVFRSVTVGPGCLASGTIEITSATHHTIGVDYTGCIGSPVCAPTIPTQGTDGLFRASVDFSAEGGNSPCTMNFRVIAPQQPSEYGFYIVRLTEFEDGLCL